MATQKLYAGVKLRETRTRLGLTQKAFAEKLGVSLPYLNQMENNNRPVSTGVVLALAQEFGFDVAELSTGDAERLVTDMREALADPVFADARRRRWPICGSSPPTPPRSPAPSSNCTAPTGRTTNASPRSTRRSDARAIRCKRARGKRCAISSTIATITSTRSTAPPSISCGVASRRRRRWRPSTGSASSVEIVQAERIRGLDRDAETAGALGLRPALDAAVPAAAPGRTAHPGRPARRDPGSRPVSIRRSAPDRQDRARQLFRRRSAAALYAGSSTPPAIPGMTSNASRCLFGASIEQIAHRLSTMQRPGAKGVPFFFVRVDQAGTITKRHSATRLQFARFGGACPLWNVHRAFETPGPVPAPACPDAGRCALHLARPRRVETGRRPSTTPRGVMQSPWAARSNMPTLWSMPTGSTWPPPPHSSRSASPAGSASAPAAINVRCRRSNASSGSTPTRAGCCPTRSAAEWRRAPTTGWTMPAAACSARPAPRSGAI